MGTVPGTGAASAVVSRPKRAPSALDAALAVGIPLVQLILLLGGGALRPFGPAGAGTVVLVLLQGLPLLWRRSRPRGVFAVVLVANSVYYATGRPPTGYDLGLALALYTVAAVCSLPSSLTAYLVIVAETLAMKLLAIGPYWGQAPWFLVTYLWVFFGAAWLWGRYQQVRRQRTNDLLRQAEHEQRALADAAVRDERTRIARELHDVIAHHLSLMVIQAGGARRLVEQDPQRARDALAVIEEYGRRGLEAMPGLLRALRTDTSEDWAPSPRLDDVADLVADMRRSGLPVSLHRTGTVRRLPDSVELSAYRIVQESLTNVVRHAASAPVQIELDYRPDQLRVEVVDQGPGITDGSLGTGHGVAGMRERVHLLGGQWQLSNTSTGGCRVVASFPCQQDIP